MIVDEVVVLVRRRVGLGKDVHKGPARVGEVDRPGGKPLDGIADLHSGEKPSGVGLSDGMGDVEQEPEGHGTGLLFAAVMVKGAHEVEELLGHGGCADQDVPLAGDLDIALGRLPRPVLEVAGHILLGPQEGLLHGLGHTDRKKAFLRSSFL